MFLTLYWRQLFLIFQLPLINSVNKSIEIDYTDQRSLHHLLFLEDNVWVVQNQIYIYIYQHIFNSALYLIALALTNYRVG